LTDAQMGSTGCPFHYSRRKHSAADRGNHRENAADRLNGEIRFSADLISPWGAAISEKA
jgi:hypothetical protein